MTRNHPRRQARRPAVEAVEARILLSVSSRPPSVEPAEAVPAESSTGIGSSSSAAVSAQDAIIGASEARLRFGVTGKGLTAAVIDTGVDYDHPAFGGGIGAGRAVVGGHDFSDGDTDPMASTSPHGTAVAGIIASRAAEALGVAPEAGIAALRVFDESGRASFRRIGDALQWVIDNHKKFNISVVNLSISDGKNHPDAGDLYANPANYRMFRLIDELEALNIPVVTAAGNGFDGSQGMGYTAIVDDTISVTGSDGDRVAADAQRLGAAVGGASATDLLAPGRGVRAPWEGSSYISLDGTSFAAPQVTGAVLLLQELHLKRFGTLPTVDQLESWLRDSAVKIRDDVTGITIGRLDIPAAAALVPSPKPASPTPPQGGGSGTSNGSKGGGSSSEDVGSTPSKSPSDPVSKPSGSDKGSDKGKGSDNGKGSGSDNGKGSGSDKGSDKGSSGGGSKSPAPGGDSGGSGSKSGGSGSSSGGSKPVKSPVPSSPQEPAPPASPSPTPTPTPTPTPEVPEAPATPEAPEAPATLVPGPEAMPPVTEVDPPAEPTIVVEAPAPVAPEPAPVVEEAPAPATGTEEVIADQPQPEPGPSVIGVDVDLIDTTIDLIGRDEDEATQPEPEPTPESEAGPDGPGPVVVPVEGGGPSAVGRNRPIFVVRAWNLGSPGSATIWSRAQILRASRLAAAQRRAQRVELARPFQAAMSRPLAPRRPSV